MEEAYEGTEVVSVSFYTCTLAVTIEGGGWSLDSVRLTLAKCKWIRRLGRRVKNWTGNGWFL
jgi:hypothetical protein